MINMQKLNKNLSKEMYIYYIAAVHQSIYEWTTMSYHSQTTSS